MQVPVSFIVLSPEHSATIPGGAWASFECCAQRSNACLLSLCGNAYTTVEPVSWDTLERIHPHAHLAKFRTSRAALLDVFEIDVQDGPLTDDDERHILTPMRRSVGATMEGARRAFANQSIVMVPGGGNHHASPDVADGSGIFADVPLAWMLIKDANPNARALYIDVDVHHANGFANVRADNPAFAADFYMLDLYNDEIWPFVDKACASVAHVNIAMPFQCGIGNRAYLALLAGALQRAERELPAVHMVFYMCSNDAMMGDRLGKTNVTERAIYQRDRMVVAWARARNLPMVIMPSRGYGPSSCRVARESMARLDDEFGIF